jgi:mannose-6-phosphate isomerase
MIAGIESLNSPLRCRPFLRPMVWGGRRLADELGKCLPGDGPFGESWEVSDHASHHSTVELPSGESASLRDLVRDFRRDMLGPSWAAYAVFPWLVKFLDARDWLSVQVHPDEETVKRLWPGEGSKTEAWFVLAAEPESRIYAGLLPGVDQTALRKALAEGRVAECLHQFAPGPGDCLYLPAGTVHAVGGGVLMAEVQQTSDATFRLFDWNRKDASGRSRQLHIEEALASIHWDIGPVEPVRVLGYDTDGPVQRQSLVQCRYFDLDYFRSAQPFSLGGKGRLQVAIALHGRSTIQTGAGRRSFDAGQTLILPAVLGPSVCMPTGNLGVLTATLPDRS